MLTETETFSSSFLISSDLNVSPFFFSIAFHEVRQEKMDFGFGDDSPETF